MPRAPRTLYPGALYHVATRSAASRRILPEHDDVERLIELMPIAFGKYRVHCHAFCVMGTHYHLLVTPQEQTLSRALQWLNGQYAAWFNEKHATHAHVFGARFTSVHVESDAHLLYLLA